MFLIAKAYRWLAVHETKTRVTICAKYKLSFRILTLIIIKLKIIKLNLIADKAAYIKF